MQRSFVSTARRISLGAAALAGLFAASSSLSAQSLSDQTRGPSTAEKTSVVSVNPFLPLAGYFQGEYEHRIAQNASVAVSGARVKLEDIYTSVDVKLRLYPQDRVLENLGISAGLGYGSVRDNQVVYCDIVSGTLCPNSGRRTESAPTFAVEAHYQWLLGNSRSTAVAFGGGAKRYFISDEKSQGIERIVPTLRLTIGYAF